MTYISTNQGEQQFKYNGKEYDPMHGLNEYDYGARQYDPARGQFTTMDPLCEKYYHISPYAYCGGNPVNAVDPDGRSTWVTRIDNYHYRVVGGDLCDNDLGIYVGDFDEDHTFIRKECLGQTTSITSFYNSDANGKNGTWVDCIIDLTDQSGINFLSYIIEQNPSLLDYMLTAQNDCTLDFKVTNGTGMNYSEDMFYRGMPTGIIDENGNTVYSSARDIGNIAAGYIAAANHIGWDAARKAFDLYQGELEGVSTKNAQLYGWNMGNTTISNIRKTYNLIRSSAQILRFIPFLFK
jgi:RHS repeat-associated protein